jgi:hypothetical protein
MQSWREHVTLFFNAKQYARWRFWRQVKFVLFVTLHSFGVHKVAALSRVYCKPRCSEVLYKRPPRDLGGSLFFCHSPISSSIKAIRIEASYQTTHENSKKPNRGACDWLQPLNQFIHTYIHPFTVSASAAGVNMNIRMILGGKLRQLISQQQLHADYLL